ncbi:MULTISPECIES: aromatase/cyclase [Streptomyces]|uniref:Cyclase n=1 Tax=Streptomyces tsukubensis (strain DSM 42081 / NBRC 108919 / NRRL 18488 / 9993) TaxID=1114943 RepID=I2N5E0_STRT9|nr:MULTISPECIES: aromatase/cyclase [Streptomyces]AZK96250.1 cyclase [Streptomyces tsukubensis]EIF92237.1 cyclase/dehydrase [Streptomyces tsukubensis NRRL18488]MYS67374.1 cyclase [Streptomyces sp. SID5473]QKM67741.1 cyclase [Streptomyces tsukubensis NRRL18488]TAI44136.1 cyclase [Streptomyces tsukubensis]
MTNQHRAEHRITVEAPARAVFDLIADVDAWPRVFPPTVHVDVLERTAGEERIRIWATANDSVKTWTSRRVLDPAGLRVSFRQEVSSPPVAAMGGEWIIEPQPDSTTLVRLTHDFRAVDDDPEGVDWITRAIDRNSDAELGALKRAAEQTPGGGGELSLHFDDVVEVAGDPAEVYEFLYDAGQWEKRLPHVNRVELDESTPNLQLLEMDTLTPNGAVHTTKSVRVCFPAGTIVYKQLRTPALMTVHNGRWRVEASPSGCTVTSTHTVVLNPDAVVPVLGEGATVQDARTFVRDALGRNSTATMLLAKEHAERAVRDR